MPKINYIPELLSREDFEKFIQTPLGQIFTQNNAEFKNIVNGDYQGSDDIYNLEVNSKSDLDIAFSRIACSCAAHLIKLTNEYGNAEEKEVVNSLMEYINDEGIPYPTRMLVIKYELLTLDVYEKIIAEVKNKIFSHLPEKIKTPLTIHIPKPE